MLFWAVAMDEKCKAGLLDVESPEPSPSSFKMQYDIKTCFSPARRPASVGFQCTCIADVDLGRPATQF